jgi:hypothetical protein
MVYSPNTLTKINKINDEMKSLNKLFEKYGWKNKNNNNFSDHITYYKPGHETEFFKFEFDNVILDLNNTTIYVSVPLKNSIFQYKTKFTDYFSAIEYTENKLIYFIDIFFH